MNKNRKFRISKNIIQIFCLLVAFFEPSYFAQIPTLDTIYFIIQLCALLYVLSRISLKKKIKKVVLMPACLLAAMHATLMLSTYLNGGGIGYDMKKLILDVGFILVVQYCINIDLEKTVCILLNVLMIIASINLWSLFAFYEVGMYEGNDGMIQYFWGTDNHFSSLLLSLVVLAFYYKQLNVKGAKYKFLYCLMISTVTIIKAWSATTLIGFAILLVGMFFCKWIAKASKVFNYYMLIPIAIILQVLVVGYNIQEKFTFIFEFLGKSPDLSQRTRIWNYALEVIQSSVFIGKGSPNAFGVGGWYYNTFQGNLFMHNEFLELWVNGGIFAVIFFVAIFIGAVLKNRHEKQRAIVVVFGFYIFSMFVMMISETVSPRMPIYVVLLLAYYRFPIDAILERRNIDVKVER